MDTFYQSRYYIHGYILTEPAFIASDEIRRNIIIRRHIEHLSMGLSAGTVSALKISSEPPFPPIEPVTIECGSSHPVGWLLHGAADGMPLSRWERIIIMRIQRIGRDRNGVQTIGL